MQGAQLPQQMVRQGCRLGEEVLEGRLFTILHFDRGAKAGIKIFREKRSEIDLFEGVLFFSWFGRLLDRRRGAVAIHLLFARGDFIQQGDSVLEFLENRVFGQFRIDHVRQLKFVEGKDTDHLHEPRSQNLLLRYAKTQLGLQ